MRMCQAHWGALRMAIGERGLTSLIATSGATAAARMKREVEKGADAASFDPLMAAHNAIVANLMGIGGLSVMAPNGDGSERCPLCYVNQQHKSGCPEPDCTFTYDNWVTKAADDALVEAKRLRLVASA